jgi:cholesterol transport system auxiliary component
MPHSIVQFVLRGLRFARLRPARFQSGGAPGESCPLHARPKLHVGLRVGAAAPVAGGGRGLRAFGAMGAIWATVAIGTAGAIGVAAALGGCAGPGAAPGSRYDLGPANLPAQADPLPALRMYEVHAPRALDSDAILYRLSYADPRRTAAYANSHWTMTPAQLLTQRLRAVLSTHGTVLAGGTAVNAPLLTVDLEQFEQVFESEGKSHGALTARATLMREGKVLAQRTFIVRAPASMPDAAGGVDALAAASDDFVAQLVAWLGMQTLAFAQ